VATWYSENLIKAPRIDIVGALSGELSPPKLPLAMRSGGSGIICGTFCAIESYERGAAFGWRLYGLPWQLVVQSWGQEIKRHWACLLRTDHRIDFFTSSENMPVTKSFAPHCLAPCKMNKLTAFSAYSSTSGGTRSLIQGMEIWLNGAHWPPKGEKKKLRSYSVSGCGCLYWNTKSPENTVKDA